MFDWLKRLRSSRGFGIHSPFAYNFVLNVLRERYPYYAYDEIIERDYRLLYRIALSLCPSEIRGTCVPHDVIRNLPSASRNRAGKSFPLYVITKDATFASEDISAPYAALILDIDAEMKKVLRRLTDSMDGYGMVFSNPRRAVVVADPDLPRQNFSINF